MTRVQHVGQGEAELEQLLRRADEAFLSGLRGQAGRYPARRLASTLRRQGFLPTQHFLDRLRERAQARGIRFDPRTFGDEFRRAQHFQQTRPGYNTRIALMRGLPILYRSGGERGNRIVLAGLLPEGALPPTRPIRPPHQREAESTRRTGENYHLRRNRIGAMVPIVRNLDDPATPATRRLSRVEAMALLANLAQVMRITIPGVLAGRVSPRSLQNQLNRPRWRFLRQFPTARARFVEALRQTGVRHPAWI